MEFKHSYSVPDRSSDLLCEDPSLAQQSFKDEVDINYLLERFRVTGQMPQGVRVPTYGDFTGLTDYRSALDAVNRANDSFMALPAEVRSRFGNDPQKFIEFASDSNNLDELRKLGLAVPAKPDVGGIGGAAPDAKPDVGVSGAVAPDAKPAA